LQEYLRISIFPQRERETERRELKEERERNEFPEEETQQMGKKKKP